ncbi:hypothetical protein AB0G79_14625 [Streptomyces sp. NPDC020807]|uniref:hypothetical protein n=1 Tax=Streptomyces sp. NPDC020807 TaxID=3155119 RepID=UPI0033ED825D
MGRRRVLIALVAMAAITIGGLAGCSEERAPEPTVPARELTGPEQARLGYAEELLVQRCMERKGFRYRAQRPLEGVELQNSGFVLDDVEWARAHGYGSDVGRKVEAARRDDPNRLYAEGLSGARLAQYRAALLGGPDSRKLSVDLPTGQRVTAELGGCQAQAGKELYGDPETWFRVDTIAVNLLPLYVPQLVKDERFADAVDAWARCMRGKGHDYADPNEIDAALPALLKKQSPAAARTTEVRLAVAEATCAHSSGLAATGERLEREYRLRASKPYASELATRSRLQHTALAQAGEIVGSLG